MTRPAPSAAHIQNPRRARWPSTKAAAAAVAKDSKLDYVVVNDAIPPIEPAGFAATRQQLAMRRVLFASTEMDITDAVIAKANTEFKSRGGSVPPALAAPAPVSKPNP